ncbi:MAG: FkbM family methyltransferase [Bryobacterales bacterium]|nr:FkbM family methyltransferase [Bryobacterales bacterium]
MAVGKAWNQNRDFARILRDVERRVSVEARDEKFGLELIRTPTRSFWVKEGQDEAWSGRRLLAYLLAEHDWVEAENPENMVRPGDVVVDCGAHVGVFTSKALRRGAARVVAVEPDPTNLECLRRNLAEEAADGRVVIVPRGVWSTATELVLVE